MSKARARLAGAAVLVLLTGAPAWSVPPPLFRLLPVVGSVEDRFGNGLAVSRDRVLVASYLEDAPGVASLYDLATGAPVATLEAPASTDDAYNDGFGFRVAASRRLLAVARALPPSLFVYDARARPLGSLEISDDRLDPCGWVWSLAMRGRRIAAATACGVVLVDWPHRRQTIARPDVGDDATFGLAVALSRRQVLVGSVSPSAPGTVYAFDAMTGAVSWQAHAPAATPGDGFGRSLAVVGSRVLVGAPGDDADGPETGAVYLLDAATGGSRRRYANVGGRSGEAFGTSVAGDGRVVLVGAPDAAADEHGAGVGYVLDGRTGALLDRLVPRPDEADAAAGRAVAVTRSRLLVGGSDWSGIGMVGVYER